MRTYLSITVARTQLALAGKSQTQVLDAINSALDKSELPALEDGAMCYMLSKQGYLGDQAGHFHPHLMFWAERTEPKSWGAGMPGSPMIGGEEIPRRLTVFIIPVGKWSDGTAPNRADCPQIWGIGEVRSLTGSSRITAGKRNC